MNELRNYHNDGHFPDNYYQPNTCVDYETENSYIRDNFRDSVRIKNINIVQWLQIIFTHTFASNEVSFKQILYI